MRVLLWRCRRDTYRVKVVFDLSLRPYVLYVYYFSSFFHSFFSKLFSFFFSDLSLGFSSASISIFFSLFVWHFFHMKMIKMIKINKTPTQSI